MALSRYPLISDGVFCPDCGGKPLTQQIIWEGSFAFCNECGWPHNEVWIGATPDSAIEMWKTNAIAFTENRSRRNESIL